MVTSTTIFLSLNCYMRKLIIILLQWLLVAHFYGQTLYTTTKIRSGSSRLLIITTSNSMGYANLENNPGQKWYPLLRQ